jgi:hypothetical protein
MLCSEQNEGDDKAKAVTGMPTSSSQSREAKALRVLRAICVRCRAILAIHSVFFIQRFWSALLYRQSSTHNCVNWPETTVLAFLKNLKRVMAAEYSRDLSAKVQAGASRFARLGFKLGGRVGYALRRQLVDE